MRNQLSKKLSAFIVTAILFSASANAQITYTDVNPDIIQTCQTFQCSQTSNLDLNNDGVLDLKLDLITSTVTRPTPPFMQYFNGSIKASPLNGSSIITNGSGYPLKMNLNEVINSNSSWSNSSNQLLIAKSYAGITYVLTSSAGNWMNTINGFLGFKIVSGTQTYYGWVRLSINMDVTPTNGSFKIIDYAYNSIPNQLIRAGETSCTIPTVNLTQSGPLSFCSGDSVTLTENGTGYRYQWKKNNVNIAGATAQTYVAKTAGTYKCKVTNSCGSKTSGGKTVTVPCRNTNDNVVETLEHLSVYPNPATNAVTIKFPSDEAGEIQVVNLFGQIVYSEKINAEQAQVDVSKFAAGMYVIRWNSGKKFETKNFSVAK